MPDEDVRYTLTLVGDRQQLHCATHPEPLLLGEWLAEDDWNPATADAIETAIRAHGTKQHHVAAVTPAS